MEMSPHGIILPINMGDTFIVFSNIFTYNCNISVWNWSNEVII